MQRSASWLGEKINLAAGRSASIRQGSFVHSGLTASATMHEHEVIDGEGFLTKVLSYDWMFVAEDLPANFKFRNGDLIVETIDGVDTKYEVMPLGTKPCVEDMDTSGVLKVVHTKRLASDA